MTIKRRLFISNLMMIVIPVLLSMFITSVMAFAVFRLIGGFSSFSNFERHSDAVSLVQEVATRQRTAMEAGETDDAGTCKALTQAVVSFGEKYQQYGISLSLYDKKEPISASDVFFEHDIMPVVLSDTEHTTYIIDNLGIHAETIGDYRLVLVDTWYSPIRDFNNQQRRQVLMNVGILVCLVVIAVIIATNRFLTKLVFKSIVGPLDLLVYGVNQIRDGNLEYRIRYQGKDEFAAVCDDFNEMARRLRDMVAAQQRGDENRRELIAGISHDLRTPLTSIKAYVEGLEKGIAKTPEHEKKYLATIKRKTKELEHIVSQLFLFSKLDIEEFPLRLEPMAIDEFLHGFEESVKEEYAEKGLEIQITNDAGSAKLLIDRIQLGNVFLNIAENALKYGKEAHKMLTINCVSTETAVTISLIDNGPGVAPEALEKLFNAFYRSDKARSNVGQGSGLGLAISAKIIERHGGQIGAANRPECGLVIIITLPLAGESGTGERES